MPGWVLRAGAIRRLQLATVRLAANVTPLSSVTKTSENYGALP